MRRVLSRLFIDHRAEGRHADAIRVGHSQLRWSRLSFLIAVLGALLAVTTFVLGLLADQDLAGDNTLADRELHWRSALRPEAELHGADLDGLDLSSVSARGAVLLNASAAEASFDDADLRESSFDGADLHSTSFVGTRLRGASMTAVDLTGANFQGTGLREVDLRGSRLLDARFVGVSLQSADIRGLDLSDVTALDFTGRPCWDDATLWPWWVTDLLPPQCPSSANPLVGRPGVRYEIATMLAQDFSPSQYSEELHVEPGEWFFVSTEFWNSGTVPAKNVLVVSEMTGEGFMDIDATSVEIVSSSFPHGFVYPEGAAQAGRTMVNVDIGSFAGDASGYLYYRARMDPDSLAELGCGTYRFQVVSYATPAGVGAINDEAFVIVSNHSVCSSG